MEIAKGNPNHWRARRDSNPQPSDPKSDALSELSYERVRKISYLA